jgi:hypothetical protein
MMGASAIRDLIEAELAPGPIANDQASIEADIRARAATQVRGCLALHAGSYWCFPRLRSQVAPTLCPPIRYVSVVPFTGDLEFNSSPKE